MLNDNFQRRKKDILSKLDKSSKKSWDEKITGLCDKINKKANYYTTSSCSGRVVVLEDLDKKGPGMFKGVFHDVIKPETFLKYLPQEKAKLNLKFKQEPAILHVACKTLKNCQELLNKAKLAGFKKSGVISISGRFMVELSGTEKLEFPLTIDGKFLLDEGFLKIIIKKSNENLKKGWEKIEKLRKLL